VESGRSRRVPIIPSPSFLPFLGLLIYYVLIMEGGDGGFRIGFPQRLSLGVSKSQLQSQFVRRAEDKDKEPPPPLSLHYITVDSIPLDSIRFH